MFCFQVWLTIFLYCEKWSSIHALFKETSALNSFLKSILMVLKVCSVWGCFSFFFLERCCFWLLFLYIYRLTCSPISLYFFFFLKCICGFITDSASVVNWRFLFTQHYCFSGTLCRIFRIAFSHPLYSHVIVWRIWHLSEYFRNPVSILIIHSNGHHLEIINSYTRLT